MIIKTTLAATAALALSACASGMGAPTMTFSQASLPAAVQVPAGHKVAMETVGVGQITYECRAKKDMAGHEWVFVGPDAQLMDRMGQQVGKYHGPPATWESNDGSKLTGAQVAVAPAVAGSLPLQLVKANTAMGTGAMQGVTYIQRVATRGGVAPAMTCDAASMGRQQAVQYQADYIFWKAA
ncbi:DUF3455 domain-containing protein [Hydrogenophaga sp.]|uniref:DUF3455 domain-containing protein n=1 Tax=Hydrogenophaga sp. TaxID=1904254 RepID=UPI00286DFBE5|nr:DUF3455 domain-containing protein [Hydrogenophaga sp.]